MLLINTNIYQPKNKKKLQNRGKKNGHVVKILKNRSY